MPLFIHAADIHLDSPLRGLARYEGAPVEAIRGATRRAFEALIDLCIEKEAAFLLLAGDLYDGDWRDYNTGLFFNRQMARLDRAGIPVFVVAGNHDAQSKITSSLRPPPNTHVFSSDQAETIEIRDSGAAIHGQSYASAVVQDDLASCYPDPVPGVLNIGILHTSIDGRPGHEPYAPCSLDTLRAKGYQYWALGHVHTPEIVSTEPFIVFSGCIQGRHIRETGVRGCMLVSYEDGEVLDVRQHPLDVMRWVSCRVSVDGMETEQAFSDLLRESLGAALDDAGALPIAVRIVCEGATLLHRKLQSDPERFESLVRSLGAEIDDELIWIEQIRFRTTGRRSFEEAVAEGSPLSPMLCAIADYPTEIVKGSRLHDEISILKNKLPHELFRDGDGLNLDEASVIEEIVVKAGEHLLSRLLVEGIDQ